MIRDFFQCGIFKNRKNQPCVEIIVTRLSDIKKIIIPLLQEYPLQGAKLLDYQDFVKVAELMQNKTHLTQDGLDQVKKIKNGMNKNRKILNNKSALNE